MIIIKAHLTVSSLCKDGGIGGGSSPNIALHIKLRFCQYGQKVLQKVYHVRNLKKL